MDGHKIFRNAAAPVLLMLIGLNRCTHNLALAFLIGAGLFIAALYIDGIFKDR